MSKKFFDLCQKGDLVEVMTSVLDSKFKKEWVKETHKTGVGVGWVHFSQKFPLYVAVEGGHCEVVEYLLDHFETDEIDINQHQLVWGGKIGYLNYDETCLHVAGRKGFVKIAKLLLNFPGIKVNEKDKAGKTALSVTTHGEIRKMIKMKMKDRLPRFTLDLNYTNFTKYEIDEKSVPIVYRSDHNIGFQLLETLTAKLHPFDARKFEKIVKFLKKDGLVEENSRYITSEKVEDKVLEKFHTAEYIKKMSTTSGVLEIIEMWFYGSSMIPFGIINSLLVSPMKYQCGGTILAGELALRYGWSINLGGGMHHCSSDSGGGWCPFGDIQMAIVNLREQKRVQKVMIVDLDAHQGNGYETDKLDGNLGTEEAGDTFIVDYYVHGKYPNDVYAMDGIDMNLSLPTNTTDEKYLCTLKKKLKEAFRRFGGGGGVDLFVYNAGTDIMVGDTLGGCQISAEAIVERDFIVFRECFRRKVPIMMVTSGGYQQSNGRVIATSILNLQEKLNIMEIARENYESSFCWRGKNCDRLKFSLDDENEEEGEEEEEEEEEESDDE